MGIGCNSCRLRFLGSTTTFGFSGAAGAGVSSLGAAIRARGGSGEAFATKGSSSASREPAGSGAGGRTVREVSSAIDSALEALGASVEVGFSSSSSGWASALRGVRAFLGADGSLGARGI